MPSSADARTGRLRREIAAAGSNGAGLNLQDGPNRGAAVPWDHIVCAVAALAQITTIRWTWDLWAERSSPPNLPLVDGLASIGWGPILVVLCVATLIRPRWGGPAFGGALLLACLGDQTRIQPGVISVAVLMIAPAYGDAGRAIARWHLCAMWLWAGLHKLLSPGWGDLGAQLIADSFGRSAPLDLSP